MNDQAEAGGPGTGKQEDTGGGTGGRSGVGTRVTVAFEGPHFEHERLQAYLVARESYALVAPWLDRKMPTHLRDQLDRAMVSMLSNIAEGAGKLSKPDKRRSYAIARGSTTEAAAQLEIVHLRGVISPAEYEQARQLLIRVARLLHGLCSTTPK